MRSNFILAQLHKNYIQLTLNPVVTTFVSEEEGQEAIVLQEEIIPIENIYNSSCFNMWENIIQNRQLINLCKIRGSNEFVIIELFSLKTKTEFTNNLKEYISKNERYVQDVDFFHIL